MTNLYANIPDNLPEELTTVLLEGASLRVERIVSQGQASPADFWYDQPEHEWILVLQGAARIVFADIEEPADIDAMTEESNEREAVELKAGDWLNIPAHRRHRVDWTTPDQVTIWLAVFYR